MRACGNAARACRVCRAFMPCPPTSSSRTSPRPPRGNTIRHRRDHAGYSADVVEGHGGERDGAGREEQQRGRRGNGGGRGGRGPRPACPHEDLNPVRDAAALPAAVAKGSRHLLQRRQARSPHRQVRAHRDGPVARPRPGEHEDRRPAAPRSSREEGGPHRRGALGVGPASVQGTDGQGRRAAGGRGPVGGQGQAREEAQPVGGRGARIVAGAGGVRGGAAQRQDDFGGGRPSERGEGQH